MRRAVALAALLLLAGCASQPDPFAPELILAAFPDAKARVANQTAGEHEFTQFIMVPVTAQRIWVKTVYRCAEDGSFVLKNPDGNGARFDTFPQAKELATDAWFEQWEPKPGKWALSGHLTHGGTYAFGVYWD